MHVLIIPGEELNESNQYSSVFELHQALALQKQNIHDGFISIALKGNLYNSIKDIFLFKKNAIANFKNLQKKSTISFQTIEGFNVVEATNSYKLPGFFRMRYYEQVQSGLKAYNKYVKKFGSPNIIHAHSRFLTGGLIAKAIKEKYNIQYVLTEHSSFYARTRVSQNEILLIKEVINNANHFFTVSPQLGNLITSLVKPLNKNFNYLPNVIDPSFEGVQIIQQDINSPFTFLNIASLDENKAQANIIQAFAKKFKNNPSFQLQIAGSGHLENYLKELVNELGIQQQVQFLGQLNRTQVKATLQAADVFVLPSLYETFGVVLIEALACGKPVIATKCGGPENIVTSINGILVEVGNIDALSNAMLTITETYDKYNPLEIQQNCIANFGSVAFAKNILPFYNNISTNA